MIIDGLVKNKNVNFLCEDLRGLELINSNFYTCFEVLEHIEGDIEIDQATGTIILKEFDEDELKTVNNILEEFELGTGFKTAATQISDIGLL